MIPPLFLSLTWLLPAPFCGAQILVDPVPHATSYMFFAGQLPRAVITPLTPEESAKFKQVYDAVLQANAALDAEGDTLSAQMKAFQQTLTAAMIKADPSVEPLLGAANGNRLTKAQSDQIRQDQTTTLQGDMDLQAQWADLKQKMTDHRQAIDTAMVQLDPTIEPILAKFAP